eukprot:9501295-Pyramimonas_sp.AAC.1
MHNLICTAVPAQVPPPPRFTMCLLHSRVVLSADLCPSALHVILFRDPLDLFEDAPREFVLFDALSSQRLVLAGALL